MTVNETIQELIRLQETGYGSATLRAYSELGDETYRPVKLTVHRSADNEGLFPEYYGDWVEVS